MYVLCHTIMDGLFSIPNVQFFAFFLALYGIDDIALCLCFLSLGRTSLCLRMLEGFNCTGMPCFWRILLNLSDIPGRYGIEML